MNTPTRSRLKRPLYAMPDFVRAALVQRRLLEAYRSRPAYQQNDYIGWITRGKQKETQDKRLTQMLDELGRGDTYMKMAFHPKRVRIAGASTGKKKKPG